MSDRNERMDRYLRRAASVAAALVTLLLTGPAVAQQTFEFMFTGGVQTFVVPAGVTLLHVDARGTEGGSGDAPGGKGGRVETTITVTPGETLDITVGGAGGGNFGSTAGAGGFNGGGPGGTGCRPEGCQRGGGGGGGASDIRQGGTTLAHRVVVAGGGGGGAGFPGGDGGGLTGADGGAPRDDLNGDGGTQTAGGTGCASNGTLGQGGAGGNDLYGGGGGGGGYYGGGGGCGRQDPATGAGGGGSSYSAGTDTIHTPGFQAGNGLIILTAIRAPLTLAELSMMLLGQEFCVTQDYLEFDKQNRTFDNLHAGVDFGAIREGCVQHGKVLTPIRGRGVINPAVGTVVKVDTDRHGRVVEPGGVYLYLADPDDPSNPDKGATVIYLHLDEIFVVVGQELVGGEIVGPVGKTGLEGGQGAHLHIEVRHGRRTAATGCGKSGCSSFNGSFATSDITIDPLLFFAQ